MPSGHVHTMTTVALAALSLPVGEPSLTSGILTGLIVSPDLDVDGGFLGMAHLRRVPVVGGLLSFAWQVYWYPYAKIVPHRHYISHSIFFGTCLRVAWLMMPLLIANYHGLDVRLDGFGHWFVGLVLADALHIVLDNTVRGR